jgi:predicted GH43/DUF377 family glycosyl hydrolase
MGESDVIAPPLDDGSRFILDRQDVTRVLWRCSRPVLIPEKKHETLGIVDNVAFPIDVDTVDESALDIYFGVTDARIGVMRAKLEDTACMVDSTAVA